MKTIQYSCTYFAIVFSFGFLFGVIRVLFVVPYIGEEKAEILEAPLMILVSLLTARFISRMASSQFPSPKMIVVGVLALLYLLTIEFTLVLSLRELTIPEYFTSKYSAAGLAYAASLFLYTIFPYVVHRSTISSQTR